MGCIFNGPLPCPTPVLLVDKVTSNYSDILFKTVVPGPSQFWRIMWVPQAQSRLDVKVPVPAFPFATFSRFWNGVNVSVPIEKEVDLLDGISL